LSIVSGLQASAQLARSLAKICMCYMQYDCN
jgi:hypothetical protein